MLKVIKAMILLKYDRQNISLMLDKNIFIKICLELDEEIFVKIVVVIFFCSPLSKFDFMVLTKLRNPLL